MTDEERPIRRPPRPRGDPTGLKPHAPGSTAVDGRAPLARNMPTAYVVPPVVTVLDNIQSLVKAQVDHYRTVVENGGALERSEADALLKLAQTLASVQNSKRTAKQDAAAELGEQTEEQLQEYLLQSLDVSKPEIREKLLAKLNEREAASDD